MDLTLRTPTLEEIPAAVDALREWQSEEVPFQLHPGDIGWHWQFGADAVAEHLRVWSGDGRVVAVGLLDDPDLLRLTSAPDLQHDREVAARIAADVHDPERGVLPAGGAAIEAPTGAAIHEVLARHGWGPDEVWTPLRLDLTDEVEPIGLRITATGPDQVDDRIAVHQSAFDSGRFVRERWDNLVSGHPYSDARSLLGYNDQGDAVAMITVWSAGPGRPGIVEPMGVHQDHRGHGHARAINLAGAAALREMGASSAMVATPSSNTAAVAAYRASGFEAFPERVDSARSA